jgi:hypothetical protein
MRGGNFLAKKKKKKKQGSRQQVMRLVFGTYRYNNSSLNIADWGKKGCEQFASARV